MISILTIVMTIMLSAQASLLVAGVGRGREESSMLTAIKEAARR